MVCGEKCTVFMEEGDIVIRRILKQFHAASMGYYSICK